MKIVFSKINTLALCLILFMPIFIACKDDKDDLPILTLKDKLVGEWEIKSFTVDGVELKGSIIKSSKMEFEVYSGNNGDFEWYISFIDGTSENQIGDYTLDEVDKELELEDSEGDRVKLDVELSGDDLELSGILDGERYVLKAERD